MNKILNHLKNNLAIYLIILTCLLIIGISLFVTKKTPQEESIVDTSMFNVISLDETLKRFDEDEITFLVIGYKSCSATASYVPHLQYAQAKYGFQTYYLELDTIDESQMDQYNKLKEKLDMEYNFQGTVNKFGEFIGSTPMTVIIKDHKMAFGYIGTINSDTLGNLTKMYDLATQE